jgi:hypothetical protein
MAGHKTSYSVTGSITALTSNQWTCPRHKSSRLYMSPRTAPQKPNSHGSAQTSRLKGDASGSTQKRRPVPHHEHPPETLPPKISADPPHRVRPKDAAAGIPSKKRDAQSTGDTADGALQEEILPDCRSCFHTTKT